MSAKNAIRTCLLTAAFVGMPALAGPMTGTEARYGASEYVLLEGATWFDAEQDARHWGGHLVAINDADEQNWLIETFGDAWFWIGLSDHEQEGEFRWSNGDALTFENFDYDEPNNDGGAEHFVELNRFGVGLWNDLPHWSTRVGIAERVAVPEPDTLALFALGIVVLGVLRVRVRR